MCQEYAPTLSPLSCRQVTGLDLVRSLVVSGSVIAMTNSISETTLERIEVKSSSEMLLLESVKGLKAPLSIAMHKKLWSRYMALCSC
jgi:hypothetical protein